MPSYNCPHCGRSLAVSEQCVEVCQCPAAVQNDQESRERIKQHSIQTKQTFTEARQKNKMPLRNQTSDLKDKLRAVVKQVGVYMVLTWIVEMVRDDAKSWSGERKKVAEDLASAIERARD